MMDHLARWISFAGHPFLVLPASVGALSSLRGGDVRAALAVGAIFALVSLGVLLGVATGRFNDFDVSERERRPGFHVLLAAATLGLALWLREHPAALRECLIAAALLAACGVLNRWTKVSLHTVFALFAASFWLEWSLRSGLVALLVAAAVAWSRVQLGRHSSREVCAGAVLGLLGGDARVLFEV